MLLDLPAHGLDLAFRHYVAVAQQHDLIGDDIDLVQDVAGNDHITTLPRRRAKQRDHFRAGERIQAVQRFVQHQHFRVVGQRLRQPDALPHPLAVASNIPFGSIDQIHTLNSLPC